MLTQPAGIVKVVQHHMIASALPARGAAKISVRESLVY